MYKEFHIIKLIMNFLRKYFCEDICEIVFGMYVEGIFHKYTNEVLETDYEKVFAEFRTYSAEKILSIFKVDYRFQCKIPYEMVNKDTMKEIIEILNTKQKITAKHIDLLSYEFNEIISNLPYEVCPDFMVRYILDNQYRVVKGNRFLIRFFICDEEDFNNETLTPINKEVFEEEYFLCMEHKFIMPEWAKEI